MKIYVALVLSFLIILTSCWYTDYYALTDLEDATIEQLEEVPEIGPVLAKRIYNYMQSVEIEHIDQLQNIKGVGPYRIEQLKKYFRVDSIVFESFLFM